MLPMLAFHLNAFDAVGLFQQLLAGLEWRQKRDFPNYFSDLKAKAEILRAENERKIRDLGGNKKLEEEARKMGEIVDDEMFSSHIDEVHFDYMAGNITPINDVDLVRLAAEMEKYDGFVKRDKQTMKERPGKNLSILTHALVRGLRRGIGLFINEVSFPAYRCAVMNLASKGKLAVVISDDSLAFGVNMPFRTCVFCGEMKNSDTKMPRLTPLMAQQMSGRAGRRGLDTQGNLIYVGSSASFIRRLMLGELPSITGQNKDPRYAMLSLQNLLSPRHVGWSRAEVLGQQSLNEYVLMEPNRTHQATRAYERPLVFKEHDERRATHNYGLIHLAVTATQKICFDIILQFLHSCEVAVVLQTRKILKISVEEKEEQLERLRLSSSDARRCVQKYTLTRSRQVMKSIGFIEEVDGEWVPNEGRGCNHQQLCLMWELRDNVHESITLGRLLPEMFLELRMRRPSYSYTVGLNEAMVLQFLHGLLLLIDRKPARVGSQILQEFRHWDRGEPYFMLAVWESKFAAVQASIPLELRDPVGPGELIDGAVFQCLKDRNHIHTLSNDFKDDVKARLWHVGNVLKKMHDCLWPRTEYFDVFASTLRIAFKMTKYVLAELVGAAINFPNVAGANTELLQGLEGTAHRLPQVEPWKDNDTVERQTVLPVPWTEAVVRASERLGMLRSSPLAGASIEEDLFKVQRLFASLRPTNLLENDGHETRAKILLAFESGETGPALLASLFGSSDWIQTPDIRPVELLEDFSGVSLYPIRFVGPLYESPGDAMLCIGNVIEAPPGRYIYFRLMTWPEGIARAQFFHNEQFVDINSQCKVIAEGGWPYKKGGDVDLRYPGGPNQVCWLKWCVFEPGWSEEKCLMYLSRNLGRFPPMSERFVFQLDDYIMAFDTSHTARFTRSSSERPYGGPSVNQRRTNVDF